MSDVNVEVEAPEPEPTPEPEPVTEPEISVEPTIVTTAPVSDSSGMDAYVTEHRATHESLDTRFAGIEAKIEEHSMRYDMHDSSLSDAHTRIDKVLDKLNEQSTEPLTSEPIIPEEPTIIPPDITEVESEQRQTHWLRRLGF